MFIKNDLQQGSILSKLDIEFLRPCPKDGIPPYDIEKVVGRKTKLFLKKGQNLLWSHLE